MPKHRATSASSSLEARIARLERESANIRSKPTQPRKPSSRPRKSAGARAISVRNPLTGRTISIQDRNHPLRTRTIRNICQAARLERDETPQVHVSRRALRELLVEMAQAGVDIRSLPPSSVPPELISNSVEENGYPSSSSSSSPSLGRKDTSFFDVMQVWDFNAELRLLSTPHNTLSQDLQAVRPSILARMGRLFRELGPYRAHLSATIAVGKPDEVGNGHRPSTEYPGFHNVNQKTVGSETDSKTYTFVRKPADIDEQLDVMIGLISGGVDDMNYTGSGFSFIQTSQIKLSVGSLARGRRNKLPKKSAEADADSMLCEEEACEDGDSDSGIEEGESEGLLVGSHIPTPKWVTQGMRKAVFNPKPTVPDQQCFKWSVLSALHLPEKERLEAEARRRGEGERRKHKACTSGPIEAWLESKLDQVKLPGYISCPIPLNDTTLSAIEEMNLDEFSFSIFHIGAARGDLRLLYQSRTYSPLVPADEQPPHIHLGLLTGLSSEAKANSGEEPPLDELYKNHHFVWIRNLRALVLADESEVQRRGKIEICERCLTPHCSKFIARHIEVCESHNPTHISVPKAGGKNQFIEFRNWQLKLAAPFRVYADFEAVLVPTETQQTREEEGEGESASSPSPTGARHLHEPAAFAYYIECKYPQHRAALGHNNQPLSQVRSYLGRNSVDEFLRALLTDVATIESLMATAKPLSKDSYERNKPSYLQSECCHICGERLSWQTRDANSEPVVDHDHITGEYRGAAHRKCNVLYSDTKNFKVPVIFHNFKGYDSYHLLRNLHHQLGRSIHKIECIARSVDKFTCVTLNQRVRFVDSLEFLKGSLDGLVSMQKASLQPHEYAVSFAPVVAHFADKYGDEWVAEHLNTLLLQKGVYPYEYIDSHERFSEIELPPHHAFGNHLGQNKRTHITDAQYRLAQASWRGFGCASLRDYTLRYVELDVLLLASIFERFRSICMAPTGYGLDPAHFLTAPSLAWSAMLLTNKANQGLRIENMTDPDMVFMVEDGVRGGMCQVMRNYSRANVIEMPDADVEAPEKQIIYIDANNLYGKSMSQPLPTGNYFWALPQAWETIYAEHINRLLILEEIAMTAEGHIEVKQLQQEYNWAEAFHRRGANAQVDFILQLPADGDLGYLLEVDLDYPDSLHESHTDLPLAPTSKQPEPSPWSVQRMEDSGLKPGKTPKLILDFAPKRNYVVHYRLLQLYIRQGLLLRKVHRVLGFTQSAWLKGYIDDNTARRSAAQDAIAKEFFKLMNNSVFGKTIEDVRKRRNVQFFLAQDRDQAQYYINSPYCKQARPLVNDALLLMEKVKEQVCLDRPIALGATILDESKVIMYEFHYNIMKAHFGARLKLLYTDTDSLVYEITGLGALQDADSSIDRELAILQRRHQCFDFSEVLNPDTHPLFHTYEDDGVPFKLDPKMGAKKLGLMKDEMRGRRIQEFIAPRPKLYSLVCVPGSAVGLRKLAADEDPTTAAYHLSKRKGVPRNAGVVDADGMPRAVESVLHTDYLSALERGEISYVRYHRITHDKKLQLLTVLEQKRALSAFDDKSYYFDEFTSLRYHDYRIADWQAEAERMEDTDSGLGGGGEGEEEEEEVLAASYVRPAPLPSSPRTLSEELWATLESLAPDDMGDVDLDELDLPAYQHQYEAGQPLQLSAP